jgi:hypothetical protein
MCLSRSSDLELLCDGLDFAASIAIAYRNAPCSAMP